LENVVQVDVGAVTVSGTEKVVLAAGVLIVPSVVELPPLNESVTVSEAKLPLAVPVAVLSGVLAMVLSQVTVAVLVKLAELGALAYVQV
jgi:hypothetical protein